MVWASGRIAWERCEAAGRAVFGRAPFRGVIRRNEPNYLRFRAENEDCVEKRTQTKPIKLGWGQRGDCGAVGRGRVCETKPISLFSGLKTGLGGGNKANWLAPCGGGSAWGMMLSLVSRDIRVSY